MSRDEFRKAFRRSQRQLFTVACSGCGALITFERGKEVRRICVICLARALNSHFTKQKSAR